MLKLQKEYVAETYVTSKELLKTKVALLEVNNEHDSVRTGKYAFVPKESITVPNKGIMYITKKDFDNLFGNN